MFRFGLFPNRLAGLTGRAGSLPERRKCSCPVVPILCVCRRIMKAPGLSGTLRCIRRPGMVPGFGCFAAR